MKNKLIYLATPYSKYPYGRERAYELACMAAGDYMKAGYNVFCPIAHSHSIEQYFDVREGFDFWMQQDLAILAHCDELFVLMLEGYEESRGVNAEIEFAEKNNIPIRFIHYDKDRITGKVTRTG